MMQLHSYGQHTFTKTRCKILDLGIYILLIAEVDLYTSTHRLEKAVRSEIFSYKERQQIERFMQMTFEEQNRNKVCGVIKSLLSYSQ